MQFFLQWHVVFEAGLAEVIRVILVLLFYQALDYCILLSQRLSVIVVVQICVIITLRVEIHFLEATVPVLHVARVRALDVTDVEVEISLFRKSVLSIQQLLVSKVI